MLTFNVGMDTQGPVISSPLFSIRIVKEFLVKVGTNIQLFLRGFLRSYGITT